jgi:hypothetical protein
LIYRESGEDEENTRQAIQLLGAVAGFTERTGTGLPPWSQERNQHLLKITRQKLSEAGWEAAWNRGYSWTKEEAEAQVKTLLFG